MILGPTERYNGITAKLVQSLLTDWVRAGSLQEWWHSTLTDTHIKANCQVLLKPNDLGVTIHVFPVRYEGINDSINVTEDKYKLGIVEASLHEAAFYHAQAEKPEVAKADLTVEDRLTAIEVFLASMPEKIIQILENDQRRRTP